MALYRRKQHRPEFEAVQAIVESDIMIDPIEGPVVHVDIGDWLVTMDGKVWPMKPAPFAELFELV